LDCGHFLPEERPDEVAAAVRELLNAPLCRRPPAESGPKGHTVGSVEGLLAGRYELGEPLGQGATSSVFAARDRRLGRTVAVKLLASALTGDGRKRFLREARAAARVSHPNVVVVYDAGVDGGRPYLAMELVEGGDLASTLAARAPLPISEAVAIADRMLAALAALHGAGIVHRDVKPANVLLTADGDVKLTDFGIARLDDAATLTVEGSVLGTPAYLPPEQAQGERPTPAGDLYSLGAVCFEMLAGTPPFGTGPAATVALAHVSSPLPSLLERRADVPAAIVAVVERALAKRPEERWPSAPAMQAALTAAASADPRAPTQRIDPTERLRAIVARPVPSPPARPPEAPALLVPRTRRSSRAWPLVLAGVGATVAVAIGVALANRGDGDGAEAGLGVVATDEPAATTTSAPAPTTTAPPTTTTTVAATTTTAPPTTVPAGPPSIDDVIATLAANPTAAGEKGVDLLERLQEVAGEDGRDQAKKARDALKDIDDWEADDLLETSFADAARAALEPIADDGRGDEDDDS